MKTCSSLIDSIYPVTCHTDHVGPGSTFVAISGYTQDGTTHISTALARGASTIVVAHNAVTQDIIEQCKTANAHLVVTDNTRAELAQRAAAALNFPAQKLTLIGITGTKGKTGTACMIEHVLRQAGVKTALIGTVHNKIIDQEEPSNLTTPESDFLHMFLAQCVQRGVQVVVIEVSAHALSLHRVHELVFDVACFSNLAPEHLDFYTTMEAYFDAKQKIFSMVKPGGSIIINTDDDWGKAALQRLIESPIQAHLISMSTQPEAPIHHSAITHNQITITSNTRTGISIALTDSHNQTPAITLSSTRLFGAFNAYNISMATLACRALNISSDTITSGITSFQGVAGRLEPYTLTNGAMAFVDFAHTPNSFEAILSTLRPFTHHLIVVFGCGGNRDATKRPEMGRIAASYANHVIITNDNPRWEEPEDIAHQIMTGITDEKKHNVTCVLDRRQAIAHAVSMAGADSIIALLGKGHESYYLAKGQTQHLSDAEEIAHFCAHVKNNEHTYPSTGSGRAP